LRGNDKGTIKEEKERNRRGVGRRKEKRRVTDM
jgi:hypothetical protein